MAMLPVCRVCLSDNLPLNSVKIDNLTHIYEKLTNSKYNEVGYPVSMCCICLTVLRKCHKFMETARFSNNVLKQWYNKKLERKMFKARPLYCLSNTTENSLNVNLRYETALEMNKEIKKEKIDDDGVHKEVHIEFERLDNEEINNIEYNQETVPDTNTNADFNNIDTHSDYDRETKSFTNEVWLEDKPQLKNEAWLEVTPEITTDTPDMMNLPSWMEPGCSKQFQDAAGTNNTQMMKIGTNDKRANETPDDLNKAHEINTDTYMEASSINNIERTSGFQPININPELMQTVGEMYKEACTSAFNLTRYINVKDISELKYTKKIKQKQDNKTFTCNECMYEFRKRYLLIRHLKTHTGEKPFSCDMCDYRCARHTHLVEHYRTHTGEKPFTCNICDYSSAQKSSLVTHMKTHTGEKLFSCTVCSYRCTKKCDLSKHMRFHTGEKPFLCDRCDYKFAQKCDLTRHLRTHSGEKPYACHLCDYKCALKYYLTTHMKTHTGENMFPCDLCSYKCIEKSKLINHMRLHTGEKPFSCTLCSYKTVRKSALTKHMTVHTGEKPYACPLCSYKCARKYYLNTHIKTHEGKKQLSNYETDIR